MVSVVDTECRPWCELSEVVLDLTVHCVCKPAVCYLAGAVVSSAVAVVTAGTLTYSVTICECVSAVEVSVWSEVEIVC